MHVIYLSSWQRPRKEEPKQLNTKQLTFLHMHDKSTVMGAQPDVTAELSTDEEEEEEDADE